MHGKKLAIKINYASLSSDSKYVSRKFISGNTIQTFGQVQTPHSAIDSPAGTHYYFTEVTNLVILGREKRNLKANA